MPDVRRSPTLSALRWVARLLPRHIRERVFEPAYADLLLDDHEAQLSSSRRRFKRMSASVVLAAESFRVGLPTYFWHRGRVTRLGKTVALVLLSSTVIVALLTRLQYGPAGGPAP
ncbi:MAG: hypothetical protein V3U67_03000 [Gemmatimonadota bacterium]